MMLSLKCRFHEQTHSLGKVRVHETTFAYDSVHIIPVDLRSSCWIVSTWRARWPLFVLIDDLLFNLYHGSRPIPRGSGTGTHSAHFSSGTFSARRYSRESNWLNVHNFLCLTPRLSHLRSSIPRTTERKIGGSCNSYFSSKTISIIREVTKTIFWRVLIAYTFWLCCETKTRRYGSRSFKTLTVMRMSKDVIVVCGIYACIPIALTRLLSHESSKHRITCHERGCALYSALERTYALGHTLN